MDCFIKKVWQGKGEEVHNYFVRFSRGVFEKRALLSLQRTAKIKLRGSFEWANDFASISAQLANLNFSGTILSKNEIPELSEFLKKKKEGIMLYEVSNVNSEKIGQMQNRVYCMLLNAESPDIVLKTKKKLPKPGKSSEGKADDKFCQLDADLKYWPQIKEAFMIPECKKYKISHTIIIEEIIIPEREEDFSKIRELAKRKGKIIRNSEIEGKESKEEKEFVA